MTKPKKLCADCGLPRNHPGHGGAGWDHIFADPRKAAWRDRKARQLAQEPRCALADRDYGPCWGALDAHHVAVKGMGGTSHDDSPLVTLCRAHHSWAHEHTAAAREIGLLAERR